jgi:GntR family transcriptional regulator
MPSLRFATGIDNGWTRQHDIRMVSPTPLAVELLQRDASSHLWEQVTARLASEIAESSPGVRLASEAEQARRLGVSRVTLRQALSRLRERGLVESKPGRGWFVADGTEPKTRTIPARPIFEPPGKLMSFSEMARQKGSVPDSIVLEQQKRPATFDEAEALVVMPGADVFVLRRVRRLNGVPLAVDHSIVPLHLLPDALTIDFERASLQAALKAASTTVAEAETEVQAILANAELAKLLEVEIGSPLLKVRQAIFDTHGRPVESGTIVYRADRYRFRSKLRV